MRKAVDLVFRYKKKRSHTYLYADISIKPLPALDRLTFLQQNQCECVIRSKKHQWLTLGKNPLELGNFRLITEREKKSFFFDYISYYITDHDIQLREKKQRNSFPSFISLLVYFFVHRSVTLFFFSSCLLSNRTE